MNPAPAKNAKQASFPTNLGRNVWPKSTTVEFLTKPAPIAGNATPTLFATTSTRSAPQTQKSVRSASLKLPTASHTMLTANALHV